MAKRKITRKVIAKPAEKAGERERQSGAEPQKGGSTSVPGGEAGRVKKVCYFCQSKSYPSYLDISLLHRFTTERAKIVPRAKSHLCSKHQRGVAKQIKYARHLSLLPFTPKV